MLTYEHQRIHFVNFCETEKKSSQCIIIARITVTVLGTELVFVKVSLKKLLKFVIIPIKRNYQFIRLDKRAI